MKTTREKILLLTTLANRNSNPDEVGEAIARSGGIWQDMTVLMKVNRVMPQVGSNIRHHELFEKLPSKVRGDLVRSCKEAAAYNMLLSETAERLLEAAGERGIEILPLKGLAMLDRIYSFDERSLGDMDFLVRFSNLGELETLLQELGYCPAPSELPAEFEIEYSGETKFTIECGGARIDAEFHWDPSPSPALKHVFPLEEDTLWNMSCKDDSRWKLSPEGEILFCIHHLAVRHSFARLMWFLDIHYLVGEDSNTLNWEQFTENVQKAGMTTAAHCVFSFISRYLGTDIPWEVLPKDRRSALEKAIMDSIIIDSLAGGRFKRAGIIPGIISERKTGYFFKYIFPGKDFLKARYPGVPSTMVHFHRAVRYFSGVVDQSKERKR